MSFSQFRVQRARIFARQSRIMWVVLHILNLLFLLITPTPLCLFDTVCQPPQKQGVLLPALFFTLHLAVIISYVMLNVTDPGYIAPPCPRISYYRRFLNANGEFQYRVDRTPSSTQSGPPTTRSLLSTQTYGGSVSGGGKRRSLSPQVDSSSDAVANNGGLL